MLLKVATSPQSATLPTCAILNPLLRSRGGRLSGRQYPEHEGSYLLTRGEWTSDFAPDRRDALEKSGDCRCVLLREVRQGMPGHDRRQRTAIRPLSGLKRRHDLLRCPVADSGVLVRRDVSPGERTETRNLERHVRPAEDFAISGLPKKYP